MIRALRDAIGTFCMWAFWLAADAIWPPRKDDPNDTNKDGEPHS